MSGRGTARHRRRTGAALALSLGVGACSLLAPSRDDIGGAYVTDGGTTEATAPAPSSRPETDAGCPPGTKSCGDACVSTSSAATGCAAPSCEPCTFAHAQAICVAGRCAPGPCENGWANCNVEPADGCEVDTRSSSRYCGSCLLSCAASTPLCVDAACVPRCHAVKLANAQAKLSFASPGLDVGSGDFTFEAWVRRHADFVGSGAVVLATNGEYFMDAFAIVWGAAFLICDLTRPVTDPSPPVQAPAPTDLAWHHVACVREGQTVRLFVDGVSAATGSAGQSRLTATSPAVVGVLNEKTAKPMYLGPMRWSRKARYGAAFTPRWHWQPDDETIAQFLVTRGFDGTRIEDEAGGDNEGTSQGGVVAADEEAPCK